MFCRVLGCKAQFELVLQIRFGVHIIDLTLVFTVQYVHSKRHADIVIVIMKLITIRRRRTRNGCSGNSERGERLQTWMEC